MRTTQLAASPPLGGWTSLGPSPLPSDASGLGLQDYGFVSGRTTAVAIDPNDATGNTVYVGAAYGGVWKSSNAGPVSSNPASVIWVPLTDSQATLTVGAVAVQPQLTNPDPNKSVVLAGTGETNSSADSYYGLGILRSPDAGQTWTLIPQDATGHSFSGMGFSHIAFSTTTPNLVVAAASSASLGILDGLVTTSNPNVGLYYSVDSGSSWRIASLNDTGQSVAPASVTSVIYNAAAKTFFASVRFHGFYSSNDGISWTRLLNQPGSGLAAAGCPTQSSQACPIYRGEIAIVPGRLGPSNKGEMYAWYVDANDADQGIWKTLDGGVTWTQVDDSGITNCGDLFGGCGTSQGKYNLALAAAPNGTATDLYAGATNLYKCTITSLSSNCSGSGNNTFVNLTHVYGCSDIAKVHPDQHAIDFLVANGTALLFFANDGGIYRALDGFTGLTTGTCGLTNQFDSLNATIGPLAQFVSISQSPTNPDLLFGGTQDNGAPATAFAQSGGAWSDAYSGDVGSTAINPANDSDWLLSSPADAISGVNIFHCSNGVSCHTQDFDSVASSTALGGDQGPFYTPFLLDPITSSDLLVGTCRIWRGNVSNSSFSLLSPNFENGGSGTCSGTETNLVRSLAAGGPSGASGDAQVIYAGTDGFGPSISVSPSGGHVWVTTAADSAVLSWSDRTGAINPAGFPISSIAIDPSDPSGATAYLALMGFHTPHVWKTTDAGISWTDFTGSLPDAPANTILIDPGSPNVPGTIFVGTDVGVFSSPTASPNWSEVGLAGNYLPNVAVTSLKLFNAGGLKRLRAGTYGRGVWEWNLISTPDFQLGVSNNPQTIFAGQTATYNATLWPRNRYSSPINLSCASGTTSAPPTCVAAPSSISPALQGSTFTINASGPVGDYMFDTLAAGTDAATVTHTMPLTLHVIDFALSTPAPSSATVAPGATTTPISFTVSAAGSFSNSVALSCNGLPAGSTCQFQPASIVTPTSTVPVPVTLSISTSSSTPSGSSTVTINAAVAGGPTRSQTLSLSVSSTPDYSLTIANASVTSPVNSPGTFNGTLTSINGYSSIVDLICGAGAPPNCTVTPSSVTPTASGATFRVSASGSLSQTYTFNLNAAGSDPNAIAHSVPLTFIVSPSATFDFTLAESPSSATVSAGSTAQFTVDVAPTTSSFPSNVTFTCTGLPALSSCAFNPQQIAAGAGETLATLAVSTTAPVGRMMLASSALFLPFLTFLMKGGRSRRLLSAVLMLICLGFLLSCGGGLQGNSVGGGGNPGTPSGRYDVIVTATSGAVTHNIHVTLVIK